VEQEKQAGGNSSAHEGIADFKKSKQPTNGRPTAAATPPPQNKSIAP